MKNNNEKNTNHIKNGIYESGRRFIMFILLVLIMFTNFSLWLSPSVFAATSNEMEDDSVGSITNFNKYKAVISCGNYFNLDKNSGTYVYITEDGEVTNDSSKGDACYVIDPSSIKSSAVLNGEHKYEADDNNGLSSISFYKWIITENLTETKKYFSLTSGTSPNQTIYRDANGNVYTFEFEETGNSYDSYKIYKLEPIWAKTSDGYTTITPGTYYSNSDFRGTEGVEYDSIYKQYIEGTAYDAVYKITSTNEYYVIDGAISWLPQQSDYNYKWNTVEANVNVYDKITESDSYTTIDYNGASYGDSNFIASSYVKNQKLYIYNSTTHVFGVYALSKNSNLSILNNIDFTKDTVINSDKQLTYYIPYIATATRTTMSSSTSTTSYDTLDKGTTDTSIASTSSSRTSTVYTVDTSKTLGYDTVYQYDWTYVASQSYEYLNTYTSGNYIYEEHTDSATTTTTSVLNQIRNNVIGESVDGKYKDVNLISETDKDGTEYYQYEQGATAVYTNNEIFQNTNTLYTNLKLSIYNNTGDLNSIPTKIYKGADGGYYVDKGSKTTSSELTTYSTSDATSTTEYYQNVKTEITKSETGYITENYSSMFNLPDAVYNGASLENYVQYVEEDRYNLYTYNSFKYDKSDSGNYTRYSYLINSNNTYSLNNDYSSKKYTSLTDLVNSETEKGDVWGRFSSYGYDGKVNFKLKLRIYKLYCKWLGGSRTDYLIVPAFITLPTNTERRNMKGVPSSFPGILYQKPSNGSDIFKDQKSFTSLNTVKLTDIDQKDKVTGEVTGWLKASSGVQYIEYNNQRYQYGISSFNFNNGTTQLNSGSLMQKLMDDPSLLFNFNTNAFNNSKNSCGLSYDIADQSLFENRNYSYNSYKRSSYTFTSKNTYYQNGTLLQSNTVKVLNSKCDIYINYSKFNINRSYSSPMIKETLKSSSGSIIKENTTGSKNSSQYSSIKYSTVKYMANTTITYNNYVKKATNDVKNLKFISIQGSLINNSAIENKIKSLANINKFYHTSERTGSWHDYWIDNSRNFNLNFYSIPTNELNDINFMADDNMSYITDTLTKYKNPVMKNNSNYYYLSSQVWNISEKLNVEEGIASKYFNSYEEASASLTNFNKQGNVLRNFSVYKLTGDNTDKPNNWIKEKVDKTVFSLTSLKTGAEEINQAQILGDPTNVLNGSGISATITHTRNWTRSGRDYAGTTDIDQLESGTVDKTIILDRYTNDPSGDSTLKSEYKDLNTNRNGDRFYVFASSKYVGVVAPKTYTATTYSTTLRHSDNPSSSAGSRYQTSYFPNAQQLGISANLKIDDNSTVAGVFRSPTVKVVSYKAVHPYKQITTTYTYSTTYYETVNPDTEGSSITNNNRQSKVVKNVLNYTEDNLNKPNYSLSDVSTTNLNGASSKNILKMDSLFDLTASGLTKQMTMSNASYTIEYLGSGTLNLLSATNGSSGNKYLSFTLTSGTLPTVIVNGSAVSLTQTGNRYYVKLPSTVSTLSLKINGNVKITDPAISTLTTYTPYVTISYTAQDLSKYRYETYRKTADKIKTFVNMLVNDDTTETKTNVIKTFDTNKKSNIYYRNLTSASYNVSFTFSSKASTRYTVYYNVDGTSKTKTVESQGLRTTVSFSQNDFSSYLSNVVVVEEETSVDLSTIVMSDNATIEASLKKMNVTTIAAPSTSSYVKRTDKAQGYYRQTLQYNTLRDTSISYINKTEAEKMTAEAKATKGLTRNEITSSLKDYVLYNDLYYSLTTPAGRYYRALRANPNSTILVDSNGEYILRDNNTYYHVTYYSLDKSYSPTSANKKTYNGHTVPEAGYYEITSNSTVFTDNKDAKLNIIGTSSTITANKFYNSPDLVDHVKWREAFDENRQTGSLETNVKLASGCYQDSTYLKANAVSGYNNLVAIENGKDSYVGTGNVNVGGTMTMGRYYLEKMPNTTTKEYYVSRKVGKFVETKLETATGTSYPNNSQETNSYLIYRVDYVGSTGNIGIISRSDVESTDDLDSLITDNGAKFVYTFGTKYTVVPSLVVKNDMSSRGFASYSAYLASLPTYYNTSDGEWMAYFVEDTNSVAQQKDSTRYIIVYAQKQSDIPSRFVVRGSCTLAELENKIASNGDVLNANAVSFNGKAYTAHTLIRHNSEPNVTLYRLFTKNKDVDTKVLVFDYDSYKIKDSQMPLLTSKTNKGNFSDWIKSAADSVEDIEKNTNLVSFKFSSVYGYSSLPQTNTFSGSDITLSDYILYSKAGDLNPSNYEAYVLKGMQTQDWAYDMTTLALMAYYEQCQQETTYKTSTVLQKAVEFTRSYMLNNRIDLAYTTIAEEIAEKQQSEKNYFYSDYVESKIAAAKVLNLTSSQVVSLVISKGGSIEKMKSLCKDTSYGDIYFDYSNYYFDETKNKYNCWDDEYTEIFKYWKYDLGLKPYTSTSTYYLTNRSGSNMNSGSWVQGMKNTPYVWLDLYTDLLDAMDISDINSISNLTKNEFFDNFSSWDNWYYKDTGGSIVTIDEMNYEGAQKGYFGNITTAWSEAMVRDNTSYFKTLYAASGVGSNAYELATISTSIYKGSNSDLPVCGDIKLFNITKSGEIEWTPLKVSMGVPYTTSKLKGGMGENASSNYVGYSENYKDSYYLYTELKRPSNEYALIGKVTGSGCEQQASRAVRLTTNNTLKDYYVDFQTLLGSYLSYLAKTDNSGVFTSTNVSPYDALNQFCKYFNVMYDDNNCAFYSLSPNTLVKPSDNFTSNDGGKNDIIDKCLSTYDVYNTTRNNFDQNTIPFISSAENASAPLLYNTNEVNRFFIECIAVMSKTSKTEEALNEALNETGVGKTIDDLETMHQEIIYTFGLSTTAKTPILDLFFNGKYDGNNGWTNYNCHSTSSIFTVDSAREKTYTFKLPTNKETISYNDFFKGSVKEVYLGATKFEIKVKYISLYTNSFYWELMKNTPNYNFMQYLTEQDIANGLGTYLTDDYIIVDSKDESIHYIYQKINTNNNAKLAEYVYGEIGKVPETNSTNYFKPDSEGNINSLSYYTGGLAADSTNPGNNTISSGMVSFTYDEDALKDNDYTTSSSQSIKLYMTADESVIGRIEHIMYSLYYVPTTDTCSAGFVKKDGKCYYNDSKNGLLYENTTNNKTNYYNTIGNRNNIVKNLKANTPTLFADIEGINQNTEFFVYTAVEYTNGQIFRSIDALKLKSYANLVSNPYFYGLNESLNSNFEKSGVIPYDLYKTLLMVDGDTSILKTTAFEKNTDYNYSFIVSKENGVDKRFTITVPNKYLPKVNVNKIGFRVIFYEGSSDGTYIRNNDISNEINLVLNQRTYKSDLKSAFSNDKYFKFGIEAISEDVLNKLYDDYLLKNGLVVDSKAWTQAEVLNVKLSLWRDYIIQKALISTTKEVYEKYKTKDFKLGVEFYYYDANLYADYNQNGNYEPKLGSMGGTTYYLDKDFKMTTNEIELYYKNLNDGLTEGSYNLDFQTKRFIYSSTDDIYRVLAITNNGVTTYSFYKLVDGKPVIIK